MIRRETKGGWILVTQDDHAYLSFEIMKNWGNDKFEEIVPRDEVLTAIREHDFGWKKWDSSVVLNKKNLYPKNFMEMNTKDQYVIWKNSFENLADNNHYASSLVALHFAKFNNQTLNKNPDNNTAKILRDEINEFVSKKLNVNSGSKNLNGYLPMDIRINLRYLQIGDVLSLALCHGWRSTRIENVPLNYGSESCTLELSSEDGLNYKVSPNPFLFDEFFFKVKGKKLSKSKFNNQEELNKEFNYATDETLNFSISL